MTEAPERKTDHSDGRERKLASFLRKSVDRLKRAVAAWLQRLSRLMQAPEGAENSPDAEIRSTTHVFFAAFAVLMVAVLLWAGLSSLDIMSVASGSVVPSGNIKSIQHLEGGIVRRILVREGQMVAKDQPLIELENTVSESTVQELTIRSVSLRVNMARLKAELSNTDKVEFGEDLISEHMDLVTQARARFAANRRLLDDRLKAQKQLVTQRGQSISELATRIKNQEDRKELIEEQIKISESMLKDDLTNRYDHLNLLKELNTLVGLLDENRIALGRTKSALQEQEDRLSQIGSSYRQEIQSRLEENRQSHDELAQRLRKHKDSLQRSVVRSPVDGVVKTLYVVTEGGVVRSGSTLLDIVPHDDRLIVEARLQTKDIGYVRAGQEAILRLASSDAFKYGVLKGEVVHISPDTYVGTVGAPYYKVYIATKKSYFEDSGEKYALFPGMILQVSLRTGKRTILQYIFGPIVNRTKMAMTER